jgi:hypothetical protein
MLLLARPVDAQPIPLATKADVRRLRRGEGLVTAGWGRVDKVYGSSPLLK